MKTTQYNSFFSRILNKSEDQIYKLRTESTEKINKIKNETNIKIDNLKNRHNQEKSETIQQLEKELQNALNTEFRHVQLQKQKLINKEILKQIRTIMKSLIRTPKYSEILENWIYKGTLSILSHQNESIFIQTSADEIDLLTNTLLNKVSERIKNSGTPYQISFVLDEKNLITDQGVILMSENRKLLCSNTLSSKLDRYDSKVRSSVFDLVCETLA